MSAVKKTVPLSRENLMEWARQGLGVDDIVVVSGRTRPHVRALLSRHGLWPNAWLPVLHDPSEAPR